MISIDVISKKRHCKWLIKRKIKKYFNTDYCRHGNGVDTLMDDDCDYIIKILDKALYFIVEDEEDKINNIINFINNNYKHKTIGFSQNSSREIPLTKFKDLTVIML